MTHEAYISGATLADEYIIAGRHDTPRAFIRRLASSSAERIRMRVAENRHTPHAALRVLGSDDSTDVRIAVAHNPRTPWTILSGLVRDRNPDVRLAIAENPHMPLYILSILAADENPYVSHRAKKTIVDLQAENLRRLKTLLANRISAGLTISRRLLQQEEPCA